MLPLPTSSGCCMLLCPQAPRALLHRRRTLRSVFQEYDDFEVAVNFVDTNKGMRLFPSQLLESTAMSVIHVQAPGHQWFVVTELATEKAEDGYGSRSMSGTSTPTRGLVHSYDENASHMQRPGVRSAVFARCLCCHGWGQG